MRDWIDASAALPIETSLEEELEESALVETDITGVIDQQIKQAGMSARDINQGYCWDFADRIVAAMGARTPDTLSVNPSSELDLERHGQTYDPTAPLHRFVIHHGRCYDSEAPEGRDRWQDLPFFDRRRW